MVEPVLTEQEWQDVLVSGVYHGHSVAGDQIGVPNDDYGQRINLAAMALANHNLPDDSPHKLTWADVAAAIDGANEQDGYWGTGEGDALATLAAKLTALLPPR